MVTIPRLATERLVLRSFAPEDFEPYPEMMANPEVAQYLGEGRPLDRAEAWRQMSMLLGHWELRGFGLRAVEKRSTGRFIGRIGCQEPEGFRGLRNCLCARQTSLGQGYAREGAGAALRFAREVLGHTAITSIVHPANSASIRVAQSLGAVAHETVEFYGAPSVPYRYPKK